MATSSCNDGGSTPRKRGRRSKQIPEATSPRVTTLKHPQVGNVVWGKVKNYRWWPAILIDKEECGDLADVGGRKCSHFVFWFGDCRVSPIAQSNLVDFREGYQKFIKPEGKQIFKSGIYMAVLELRKSLSLEVEDWNINKSLEWANEGFPLPEGSGELKPKGTLSQYVRTKLRKLRMKYEASEDGNDMYKEEDSTLYLEYPEVAVNLLHSVRDGTIAIEDICLACVTKVDAPKAHPLFLGSLCETCWINFVERYFAVGSDDVPYYCAICLNMGDMTVCSKETCVKSYCNKCITLKAALGIVEKIRDQDPWLCFLCTAYSAEMHGLIQPRTQWRHSALQIFHPNIPSLDQLKDVPIRILCLDGSSKIALKVFSTLNLSKLNVEAVFLCDFKDYELDQVQTALPNAINVNILHSMFHYESIAALSKVKPIHLVISSFSGTEKESLGRIFFAFHNIMTRINILNQCPKQTYDVMFLFEATDLQDYRSIISRYLSVEPSETNGDKLYWTNVPALWAATNHVSDSESEETPRRRKKQKR